MNNIMEILEEASLNKGNQIAFTFLDYSQDKISTRDITFQQIFNESVKFAYRLKKAGIQKNDRVIVFSNQTEETVYAIFGIMMARGVFTLIPAPIDKGKIERLQSVAQSAKPKYVVVNQEIVNKISVEKICGYFPEEVRDKIDVIDINMEEDVEKSELDFHREEDELAYLQYSSGSTSDPKGVMISYDNMIKSVEACVEILPYEKGKTGLAWIPFYHNLGILTVLLREIYVQTHMYIMKTEDFMENPLRWLEAMSAYKVEFTAGPNSAFGLCAKIATEQQVKKMDLSSLHFAVNGAEPVNYETLCAFYEKFEPAGIRMDDLAPSYGLAEVVCGVSSSKGAVHVQYIDFDDYKKNRFTITEPGKNARMIVSQGALFKYVKVVIVDPKTRKICDKDEIGEIWVSGDVVSLGYWGQNPEEDTVFHQKLSGYEEEFLRTGDCGILYEGELYVTGRMKDMLIVNGHNIYPMDIINDLQKRIPELIGQPVSIFDIFHGGKNRVVICLEIKAELDLCRKMGSRIKEIIKEIYDFSPYDIVFSYPNTLPRTDNGKLRTFEIKTNYETKNLSFIYSEKPAASETTVQEDVEFQDDMENQIKKIFESILDCRVSKRDDSFLEMGGNSFDTVELVKELEKEFSVTLELKDVLSNATVCGIAQMVKAVQNHTAIKSQNQNLYQECDLEENIYPESGYTKTADQSENIFITGTTGFLGAYLIASLLEQKKAENLQLFCHVRSRDSAGGMDRIQKNMKEYGLWKEEYEPHITPVAGDLEKPLLGMTQEIFDELAEKIDMIYHNGAMLHFLYPYNYLKKINVFGTKECLKLACAKRAKYFNYISSFSVFDNPSHFHTKAKEDDLLESSDGYFLGYSETKWVSEKLIEKARKRGLRTIVFRPGEITGSTASGKWKVGDLVSRSLISCIQMNEVPDTGSNYYLTPVDFVADAAAYIPFQQDAFGHAYNLVNMNIMSIRELAEAFRNYGYEIRKTTYEQWQWDLFHSNMKDNSLKIMESLFQGSMKEETAIVRRYADMEAEYDTSNVDKILESSGISCMPVNQELINKYIRNFISQGCICEPEKK